MYLRTSQLDQHKPREHVLLPKEIKLCNQVNVVKCHETIQEVTSQLVEM